MILPNHEIVECIHNHEIVECIWTALLHQKMPFTQPVSPNLFSTTRLQPLCKWWSVPKFIDKTYWHSFFFFPVKCYSISCTSFVQFVPSTTWLQPRLQCFKVRLYFIVTSVLSHTRSSRYDRSISCSVVALSENVINIVFKSQRVVVIGLGAWKCIGAVFDTHQFLIC